ncbi:MAG TPA: tetratricopeptide repeat protein [Rhizomicrobium sp.]|nr:tetratricopeptide repeat protein [Rhizomicrobium sp.]
MALAAAALGLESRAGTGAQEDALLRLEETHEGASTALRHRISSGILRRAVKAWRTGDIVRAGQLALNATLAEETNAQAYHLLAMCLERMGHIHKALVTYERAYELDPEDPDLLINLGLTAWSLKMQDAAVAMFRRYIALRPDSPLGYNNLGTIQCEMGDPAAAIATLRTALLRMPAEPVLWNALATVLAESGRSEEAIVFYEEAIRLAPGFPRAYHNLGFAYSHLGRLDEALVAYDNALARAVDPKEIIEGNHSRGVCLIGMGRLEEGFREYEIRNSPRFRSFVQHVLTAPGWNGEPLAGKRLLVVGEQGLGDELMFATVVPDLIDAVGPNGRLQIAVEHRLVSFFARSFPKAEVGPYEDRKVMTDDGSYEVRFIPWAIRDGEPDFYTTMGTPLQFLRRSVNDFPAKPLFAAEPARTAEFRRRLEAMGPGPFVGICWRSMMQDVKRQKYFSPLDAWGPVLQTKGVTFVNVQYGDCNEELARAREAFGIDIKVIDDLDLKNDIEGAAALSAALDLVLSAPTAAAAVAASTGTETWFLTAGRTWPQLGTDRFPWYAKTRVFSPEKFGDWNALMPRLAGELETFARR